MRNAVKKSSYQFRDLDQTPSWAFRQMTTADQISRWEYVPMLLVALLAMVPRYLFLQASGFGVESDEAIVGLMAKHIAEGRPVPIFYYGQHYMGSLEAILTVGVFSVLGVSAQNLKVVPLVFALLHVVLVYSLARRFVRWHFATIAAALTALGPSALMVWSVKARGGFIELVVLGSLALILAIDAMRGKDSFFRIALLGAVMGLGWWVNNQMIFYILPIAVCFALHFPYSRGFITTLKYALAGAIGFFAGGAPFWYANLAHEPRFATFEVLFGSSAGGNFDEYLAGFFTLALPILLGSRRFWTDADILPSATTAVLSLYALLFAVAALLPPKRLRRFGPSAAVLLTLFCLALPLIFSASSFGWLAKAPRYLLPLYSVLFVVVAIALEKLWDSRLRWLAPGLAAAVCSVNLLSSFYGGIANEGQPIVFRQERVSESHQNLYRWLQENGYQHVQTNYWIGYRIAFETNEAVTFSRFGYPRTLRIPQYEREARERKFPLVYVLVPGEAIELESELSRFGYQFRRTLIDGYVVIDQLLPPWPRGDMLQLQPEWVSVFNRPEQRALLFDGDESTRWGSGMPQHPGMEVRLTLPQPETLTSVQLVFGPFLHDAPRDLEVIGIRPDSTEVSLFRLLGTRTYAELQQNTTAGVDPEWNIYFKPELLTGIVFRQHASTQLFDWSIAELRVFKAPATSAPAESVVPPAEASSEIASGDTNNGV